MTAVILAGHGSHISPHTAGLVWSYVDQLRAWGVADEITACFWKEMPTFHQVLNTVQSDTVVIVPMFTAAGYFSQQVIPLEMGLSGAKTLRNEKQIYYARTLGEHPNLTGVLQQLIEDQISAYQLEPGQVTVAVIGHGTPRTKASQDTTRTQVAQLASIERYREVLPAFLDDEPDIPSIYTRATGEHIIVVPFFLAPGSHVTVDVPRALGISPEQSLAHVNGKTLYYTDPIGTTDNICKLILDLVHETGVVLKDASHAQVWEHVPAVGREQLAQVIQEKGQLTIGQLFVTAEVVQPLAVTDKALIFTTIAELRQHIRQDPFRPLATSKDLPPDWLFPVSTPEHAHAVIETVYPGVIADWAANDAIQIDTLAMVSDRQAGFFRDIQHAPVHIVHTSVERICGQCVRHPTWHTGQLHHAIPCTGPCNILLSNLKERRETI